MTSRRRTMSNQRWNNVVYVNIEIYNVEQRQINVVYFSVHTNNVRQHRNNVAVFNVEFHNFDQRRKNVVNMTIFKILKRAKKYFWASKKRWLIWLTTLAFDCNLIIRKRKHGRYNIKINVGKYEKNMKICEKNMKITVWVCWWQNKLM